MIIEQNFGAALFLHHVVPGGRAPTHYRLFITPTRQRQNPAVAGKALVANVVDKTAHLLKLGPQHFGVAEIGVPLFELRVNFEYNGKHNYHSTQFLSGMAATQSISMSNGAG